MNNIALVRRLWDARKTHMTTDRAYLAYAVFFSLLVIVVPVGRAVWLGLSSTAASEALTAPIAPLVVGVLVFVLWTSALVAGRKRGPALLPPFLTYALANSDLPRWAVYRRTLLRACGGLVAATTGCAALVGGSLLSRGLTSMTGMIFFNGAGFFIGFIAFVAWLAGQTYPRSAVYSALALVSLGVVGLVIPGLQPFLPWGWAGLVYPTSGAVAGLLLLAAVAVMLIVAVPTMLEKLRIDDLAAQAATWNTARSHAATLEINAVSSMYQTKPYSGRHIRAVRQAGLIMTIFVIRDVIGAIRTPDRFVAGVLVLACAGALIALTMVPLAAAFMTPLGALGGLFLLIGLGPFTDGIRHAAHIASDTPLYGISNGHLLASHAVMPLVMGTLIVVPVAGTVAGVAGVSVIGAMLMTFGLMLIILCTRVNDAFKGPLPLILLTPIPSPAGDPMTLVRLAWAMDSTLIAVLTGFAAGSVTNSPIFLVCMALIVAAIGIFRWRRRM